MPSLLLQFVCPTALINVSRQPGSGSPEGVLHHGIWHSEANFSSCFSGAIEHSFLTQIKPNEMLWEAMHTNEMNFKRILNSLPKIEICLTFYFQ